jgi:peptidoglycan/LPS O-acetylase OafA/YrhL
VIGSVWTVALGLVIALYPHSDKAQWAELAIIVVVMLALAVYARLSQQHHPKPPQSNRATTKA